MCDAKTSHSPYFSHNLTCVNNAFHLLDINKITMDEIIRLRQPPVANAAFHPPCAR